MWPARFWKVFRLAALITLATASTSAKGAIGSQLTADFNDDGFADLAVGVPSENVGVVGDAGAVNVVYGAAGGLASTGNQLWDQDSPGVLDAAEGGDGFGSAVVTGDFNGDGFTDIAVGSPFEDVGAVGNAGAVNVLHGSASGLSSSGSLWHQDIFGIEDVAEAGDNFGSALATGDFNVDGFEDLAVGVPGEDFTVPDRGAVNVIFGCSKGLCSTGDQGIAICNPFGCAAGAGSAVAAGDFTGDGTSDLAVGAPDTEIVGVVFGPSPFSTPIPDEILQQGFSGVNGTTEPGDLFGSALVAADFGRGPEDDLTIGVPGEDVGPKGTDVGAIGDAGAVNVVYGQTGVGLLPAVGDQLWNQNSLFVLDSAERGDAFGSSVAAANFGMGLVADLAVGVPSENIGDIADAGTVNVLYGSSSTGLSGTADQLWHQDIADVVNSAERDDRFGVALAAANFGSGLRADLAVGVSGESVGTTSGAGLVNALYGSSAGLASTGNQAWHQDIAGILDSAESGDSFGDAVAAEE